MLTASSRRSESSVSTSSGLVLRRHALEVRREARVVQRFRLREGLARRRELQPQRRDTIASRRQVREGHLDVAPHRTFLQREPQPRLAQQAERVGHVGADSAGLEQRQRDAEQRAPVLVGRRRGARQVRAQVDVDARPPLRLRGLDPANRALDVGTGRLQLGPALERESHEFLHGSLLIGNVERAVERH
ncbi:MAG: hypothetical protein NTV21_00075, partial [Planctomycetota bacterium]|nr:hypothetical protein [Planctomycetota bacterium]